MDWTIEDWQWTQTPQGQAVVARAPIDPTPAEIGKLRKKWTQAQVGVAIEYARAKRKIERKFLNASIVSDCPGVEMASSPVAAGYKASRFVRTLGVDSPVVDLCCGIGGDAIELARAGIRVVGIDHNPARAWMCAQNAKIETICCDVLDPSVPDGAFHLDPSRRTIEGTRSRSLDNLQPCPEIWETLIEHRATGAIKLHPGVDANDLPEGELEVISESGKLTQAVLWVGQLAETPRRATLLDREGNIVVQLTGHPGRPSQETAIGQYIHTVDPSVERADLMEVLLDETGLDLVHPGTGLLTGSSASTHPMTTAFAVVETMPWHHTHVREKLRALDAGIVEVKSRGQIIDTDEVQRSLRSTGEHLFCVFVLPIGQTATAIITQRVPTKNCTAEASR